jgi:hypothetical protein
LKIKQRFESLLLAPAIILGTPAEAGLNQKNSTSLTLGTQTALPRYSRRLYPKMLNGTHKNLSNLLLNFVTYLQGTTLEVVLKNSLKLYLVSFKQTNCLKYPSGV